MTISDWLAGYLVKKDITHTFLVPGGGVMCFDEAIGHQEGMKCVFVHHEQTAAIAAEGYQRISNRLPLVLVTTGPGGTNTLTGVVGAWLDSIPMFIISGQVRYAVTARASGLPVRSIGDQEFDITKTVASMTKYAVMVTDAKMMKYHVDKALYLATHGRPGPVWLDVPLDVQSAVIDPADFVEFDPAECEEALPPVVTDEIIDAVLEKIRAAEYPVFNAGNGIRIADAEKEFLEAVELLNIPVVTGWDSIDVIPDDHPLYTGRAGLMGDRPGNFAIQNSDLVLSVGSRLNVRQVGYNRDSWARDAFVIMVDIDAAELKKNTIHVEFPIQADAKDFLAKLVAAAKKAPVAPNKEWNETCASWKKDYPVVQKKHYEQENPANVYCFIKELSRRLPEGQLTVVGNGSACVVGSHAYVIKKDQRFIINSGAASMGYCLPVSIGASFCAPGKEIVCVTGDGSIQMNLQELQTMQTYKLPIKLFVYNNGGYLSIKTTQRAFFGGRFMGSEASSGVVLPSFEKLAAAYGLPFFKLENNQELDEKLRSIFATEGPTMVEVMLDPFEVLGPKAASKKLPDGSMVSAPLDDMFPFLPREEYEANKIS